MDSSAQVLEQELVPQSETLRIPQLGRHDVAVIEASRTAEGPDRQPAPDSTEYVKLLLKVKPLEKTNQLSENTWNVDFQDCDLTNELTTCWSMSGISPYLTAEQFHAQNSGEHVGDKEFLEPGNTYYVWAWQLIEKGSNLDQARLCEGVSYGENCVKIGQIKG
ncbi:hypothetical protein ACH347_06835 [Saccharopolyspora sp. 5N102]|uniref:hypothetical protein n=1 Tax=Saccharopolyspora sp. 5N102 TaxID=3375155 RepID=UPI0037A982F1